MEGYSWCLTHRRLSISGESERTEHDVDLCPGPVNQNHAFMTNNETTHFLTHLEEGFRMDSVRLKELEEDLALKLDSARHFGRKLGSPEPWRTNWCRQWDNIEGILRRTRAFVEEMAGCVGSDGSQRFQKAL